VLCTVTEPVFAIVTATTDTVGAVESIVTTPVDATDKLSAASTAYALYVPSANPDALNDVAVSAAEIDTWFQAEPAAPVILALFDTVTDVLTKYAVPVSVLCTVTEPVFAIVTATTDTVGAVTSEVRVTVKVVVVETDKFVTTMVMVLAPSTRFTERSLPDVVDVPLTVIDALPLDAVGVTRMELTLDATDAE